MVTGGSTAGDGTRLDAKRSAASNPAMHCTIPSTVIDAMTKDRAVAAAIKFWVPLWCIVGEWRGGSS